MPILPLSPSTTANAVRYVARATDTYHGEVLDMTAKGRKASLGRSGPCSRGLISTSTLLAISPGPFLITGDWGDIPVGKGQNPSTKMTRSSLLMLWAQSLGSLSKPSQYGKGVGIDSLLRYRCLSTGLEDRSPNIHEKSEGSNPVPTPMGLSMILFPRSFPR